MADPFSLVAGILGTYTACCEIFKQIQTIKKFQRDSEVQIDLLSIQSYRVVRWGEHHKLRYRDDLSFEPAEPLAQAQLDKVLVRFQAVRTIFDEYGIQDNDPSLLVGKLAVGNSSHEVGFRASSKSMIKKSMLPAKKLQWGVIGKEELRTQCDIIKDYVDGLYDIWPVQGTAESISTGAVGQKLEAWLDKILTSQRTKDLVQIEHWLSLDNTQINPHQELEYALRTIADGTCQWLASDPRYSSWRDPQPDQSSPKLLWIEGNPGSGKTLLCASQVRSFRDEKLSTAFFFSTQHARAGGRVADLLRFWIIQLAEQIETIRDITIKHSSKADARIRATLDDLWTLLSEILRSHPGLILVVDGIDEYFRNRTLIHGIAQDNEEQDFEFLRRLFKLCLDINLDCHVLIVGRFFSALQSALQPFIHPRKSPFYRLTIKEADVVHDMGLIVRSFVQSSFAKLPLHDQEEVIDKTVKVSCGSFLWFGTVKSRLKPSMKKGLLLREIHAIPVDLSKTYDGQIESFARTNPERALLVFSWVLLAKRPITVWELCQIQAVISEGQHRSIESDLLPEPLDAKWIEDEILAYCGDMIITQLSDRWLGLTTLTPLHPAVSDHILPRLMSSENYGWRQQLFPTHVSTVSVQLEISMVLLTFLNNTNVDIELDIERPHAEASSLKNYALQFWHIHLRDAPDRERFPLEQLLDFFQEDNDQFLLWANTYKSHTVDKPQREPEPGMPLYYAILLQLNGLVEKLLQNHSEQIHRRVGTFEACLMAALISNQPKIFGRLLEAGICVEELTNIARVFHAAVALQTPEFFDLLRTHGVSYNLQDTEKRNALHAIAAKIEKIPSELLARFQLLLDHGVNLNAQDTAGDTPLMLASRNGHADLVQVLLLSTQLEIRIVNNNADDALHVAVREGNLVIVDHLLKGGSDGANALHLACAISPVETVDTILNSLGVSDMLEDRDDDEYTPLLSAVVDGNIQVVEYLLGRGADPLALTRQGTSALHMACLKGQLEIVQLLLASSTQNVNTFVQYTEKFRIERGLEPDDPRLNVTAIILAALSGNAEIVQTLARLPNIDLQIASLAGKFLIRTVAGKGMVNAVKDLIHHFPNYTPSIHFEYSPLDGAMYGCHTEVVKILLEHGFDGGVDDKQRESLILSAMNQRDKAFDMLRLLMKWWPKNIDHVFYKPVIWVALQKSGDMDDPNSRRTIIEWLFDLVRRCETATAAWTVLTLTTWNGLWCNDGSDAIPLLKTIESTWGLDLIDYSNTETRASALHTAAYYGHFELVTGLLQRGASVSSSNRSKVSVLEAAVEMNQGAVVSVILDYLDSIGDHEIINQPDCDLQTPLHKAASQGSAKLLKLLILHGADITCRDREGHNALYLSVLSGSYEASELLLNSCSLDDKDDFVNRAGDDSENPFYISAEGGHLELAKLLLHHGAKPSNPGYNGWTSISAAAENGHLPICQLLLDQDDIDCMELNSNGFAAIHLASESGHWRIVEVLIQKRPDCMDIVDSTGCTALALAAQNGHYRVVHLLLRASLSRRMPMSVSAELALTTKVVPQKPTLQIKATDGKGWTALHEAALNGHLGVVKLLLEHCPELASMKDLQGRTAFHFASIEGNVAIVKELLQHDPALLNVPDNYGATSLSLAARNQQRWVVNILIDFPGIQVDVKDQHGRNAIDWLTLIQLLEHAVDDIEIDNILRGHLLDAMPLQTMRKGGWCDICTLPLERFLRFWCCEKCFTGNNFAICSSCYEHGDRCLNQQHEMQPGVDG